MNNIVRAQLTRAILDASLARRHISAILISVALAILV